MNFDEFVNSLTIEEIDEHITILNMRKQELESQVPLQRAMKVLENANVHLEVDRYETDGDTYLTVQYSLKFPRKKEMTFYLNETVNGSVYDTEINTNFIGNKRSTSSDQTVVKFQKGADFYDYVTKRDERLIQAFLEAISINGDEIDFMFEGFYIHDE